MIPSTEESASGKEGAKRGEVSFELSRKRKREMNEPLQLMNQGAYPSGNSSERTVAY